MVTYAALRAMSADPMPGKSAQLYEPQMDNWGPANRSADGEPPLTLSYTDAEALLRAHAASRQTALYQVAFSLVTSLPAVFPSWVESWVTSSTSSMI